MNCYPWNIPNHGWIKKQMVLKMNHITCGWSLEESVVSITNISKDKSGHMRMIPCIAIFYRIGKKIFRKSRTLVEWFTLTLARPQSIWRSQNTMASTLSVPTKPIHVNPIIFDEIPVLFEESMEPPKSAVGGRPKGTWPALRLTLSLKIIGENWDSLG